MPRRVRLRVMTVRGGAPRTTVMTADVMVGGRTATGIGAMSDGHVVANVRAAGDGSMITAGRIGLTTRPTADGTLTHA
ncbi:hypothetical protein [Actinoallomurus acaciae]|uniref:Uncharacterized protein n=1 Tax=Actinoallomurus acaciae TaxID=502577 RepID=A0ABV5YKA4_9ACTN